MFDPVDPSEIDIFGAQPANDNLSPSAMNPPQPTENELRKQREQESMDHAKRVKALFMRRQMRP